MTDYAVLYTLLALFGLYALLNVWKFKKPESEAGKAVMMLLMQIAVFSLKTWGLKNPKLPLTKTVEDLEKEIEQLESGDEKDERKLLFEIKGHR